MDPVNLLRFLLLGTTFGVRLLGIAYRLGGIRAGVLSACRPQITPDELELLTAGVRFDGFWRQQHEPGGWQIL